MGYQTGCSNVFIWCDTVLYNTTHAAHWLSCSLSVGCLSHSLKDPCFLPPVYLDVTNTCFLRIPVTCLETTLIIALAWRIGVEWEPFGLPCLSFLSFKDVPWLSLSLWKLWPIMLMHTFWFYPLHFHFYPYSWFLSLSLSKWILIRMLNILHEATITIMQLHYSAVVSLSDGIQQLRHHITRSICLIVPSSWYGQMLFILYDVRYLHIIKPCMTHSFLLLLVANSRVDSYNVWLLLSRISIDLRERLLIVTLHSF